ncbi:hypothetical protein LA080_007353 [Diaporthe eres]|nr:hypothetical protein LA080_007353 [Diaporthe eres]
MPLDSLQTLQHLDITGPAGSDQHKAQYDSVAGDENPARTSHPLAPAPQPASQAHPFEQTHSPPFYPPLIDPFAFDTNGAIPVDPGLVAAPHDHPPASGSEGGVASFQQSPWTPQSMNMDSFMGPTLSSTLSVHGTSTPASSQSPGSLRKVRSGHTEPRAVGKEALPNPFGMHAELRAEDQPNRKRRQSSDLKAQPKTSADKKGHRNNSSPGFSTPHALIAPAPIAAATASDDNNRKGNGSNKTNSKKNDNNNSSSPNHHRRHHQPTTTTTTTKTTTSAGPSKPPQPSFSSQPDPQSDPRERNRAAANRCRAKSKVAVAELEATERAMGAEHEELTRTARSLRDEVLLLKNELLMHGNCDDDVIQQYLANSARMVGRGVVTRR